ncbi:unnamed protein product [Citrullus colocynthis]|uniref:Phosducin domain-containing protein n=1 Tax=Citrullus colocynthis TaxID=252529 RepID=A0ABP0Y0M9_9ROSI
MVTERNSFWFVYIEYFGLSLLPFLRFGMPVLKFLVGFNCKNFLRHDCIIDWSKEKSVLKYLKGEHTDHGVPWSKPQAARSPPRRLCDRFERRPLSFTARSETATRFRQRTLIHEHRFPAGYTLDHQKIGYILHKIPCLSKLGNLPPKPAPFKPPAFTPAQDEASVPKDKSWIDQKNEEELEDLEDDLDLDDDNFLQEYRKKRLVEIREAAKISKFGSVNPISGSDFVREVSKAPSDVWVVVILYKEGIQECDVLMNCLQELAARYPATKFVKIISTDCIPNYPDCNLPTLLVYNNGAVKANYVGLRSFGRRCTPEGVALVLCQADPVLNDGQSGNDDGLRKSVLEGVRRKIIEKVVRDHEDENDEGSSSD